jgi:Asp-tRNA(Asn)/Glu-tRNA(Gln) amidotransferase A subunit family amidase
LRPVAQAVIFGVMLNPSQADAAGYSAYEKTIFDLAGDMESGRVTSVGLVGYYLERIKVYDGVLNALITVNPKALGEAERLDAMRARGQVAGPLHGIPVILKDNYNTYDMVTTSGARAFAGLQPKTDAFAVARLREAGAVILAKANLTELARHGMSVSSMIGQTLNPYDLTRTPGGSSGGTGAAVAANFAAAGTGSDTVNSIRSPASANSLVGLRPTRRLVSRAGNSPCSSFQDQGGPIARTVADAAVLLSVMAGYDPADETTEAIRGKALPDYAKSLRKGGLKNKKLALLTTNLGNDPEVTRIVRQAVADLKKLGAGVVEMDVPELHVPTLIRDNDVQQWEQKRDLDKYLAALGGAAPVKNTEKYVATGLLTPSIALDMAGKAAEKDPEKNPEYLARLGKNAALRDFVENLMRENGIDAFLYPLQTILTVQTNDPRGQAGRNGLMASVTGLPAITLPGGFSAPTDSAPLGVPVGVELMGRPFGEEALIHMGYAYEQATRHRKAPLSVPDLDFTSVGRL